jgi:predicted RNA-binding Zn ribbon-like protein
MAYGSDDSRKGWVTGQVDFDSHANGVLLATVATVNLLTPGWSHGREYTPPSGSELVEQLHAAVAENSQLPKIPPADQIPELTDYAAQLREVFVLRAIGDLDGACTKVNELLRDSAAQPVLSHHDGEPWHLHFHALDARWAVSWLSSMATSLAVLLGGSMHDRIGLCGAPSCDRVYADASRNGTRRFCSTACQNRVKTAAFRERQHA